MKIVCFGGGNAMPNAVLSGLKEYDIDITTVTSMVDSGGSTGQLRKDFNVLPPGDIRRHLLALSNAPQWKKDIFSFRFGQEDFGGGHKGHTFGNIFLAGLEYSLQDYDKALDVVHQFLEVKGRCLPATSNKTNLFAVLENGEIIEGEDELDLPQKHNPELKIKKVYLQPGAKAYPSVLEVLKGADLIAIGPGALYSALIPCFLPEGMSEVIRESKAKKILIVPPMTKFGETNDFSVSDFTNEIEKYLGCPVDYVIYNNKIPSDEQILEYKKDEGTIYKIGVHKIVEINENLDENKFIGANLLAKSEEIVYDPHKVSEMIIKIFGLTEL